MGLTLYKSSAGSGKTFTLVRLYLEKVIKSPSIFRSILAITFTNKATEEMKTRIIKELDVLAAGSESPHLIHLLDKTKLTEEDIRKNARTVLLMILHDYSSFSVSTIDSYFQVLARTLARELHLPVKYEIELDLDAICDAISNNLLSEAGRDNEITNWLEQLLLDRVERGKTWNIKSDLRNKTKQILINNDAHYQAINSKPEIIIKLISELKKLRSEVEDTLKNIGQEGISAITKSNYTLDSFAYGKTGAINYFYKITSKTISSKNYQFGNRMEAALADSDTLITKPNRKDEKLVALANEVLHPLLCQAVDFYKEKEMMYLSACEVLKNIYLAGISGSLNEKIKNFRDEFQLFLLSDTTRMLREIVHDNDAPFMYEKSGNTYRHLFIDEFQDTSIEQWQILKPLISNSLGNGNDVLLVGDAKQSIYRWRGGNMHLLLSGAKKEFISFASVTKELKLDTNYRSLENVVKFNNKFFSLAAKVMSTMDHADPNLLNQAYGEGEIEQKIKSDNSEGGLIELYFFDAPPRKNKKSENNSEGEVQEKWKAKALKQLDITIENSLNQGYELRDISILVRTKVHEQEIAFHLLKEHKYEFIAPNSLLLSNNYKIRFIINTLRLLQNSNDVLLHSEINYFIAKNSLYENYQIPFDSKTTKNNIRNWSSDVLLKQKNYLLALPIDLAYNQILQMSNLIKSDSFIDRLTDIILGYISSNGSGIFEFINWWDENIETKNWSVEIPQATNAIRILSIHKSKGLQFPIVIIPFADWSIVPKNTSEIWAHSQIPPFNQIVKMPVNPSKNLIQTVFLEDYINECKETYLDNLNVLYVAFTRAENQLHVFSSNKANNDNIGSLILGAIGYDEEWSKLVTNEDGNCIRFGEPTFPIKHKESTISNSLYSPNTVNASELFLTDKKSTIPSVLVKFESDEIIFGNYVHLILSQIKNKSDIPVAIHRLTVTQQLKSQPNLVAQLKQTTEQVWDLMDSKGWNDPSYLIKNEPDLCDENGASHRPDRVLIKGGKAIVLDFKTGVSDEIYHKQVRTYCKILEKTGILETEGYLIYTSSKKIETVSLEG